MQVGTQYTGTLAAAATTALFTHSWNPASHVVWTVVPITPGPGAAQVEWTVKVQRASTTTLTYHLAITNLSAAPVDVEVRYAILS